MCPVTMQDVVISIGNQHLTSSKAIVKSLQIRENQSYDRIVFGGRPNKLAEVLEQPRMLEVEINLQITEWNWELLEELSGDKKAPMKISKKKVEDCSIKELLFAIRSRLEGGNQNEKTNRNKTK